MTGGDQSSVGYLRKRRLSVPRMPGGEVNVQAPPDVPRPIPASLLSRLLPVVMVLAMVGMIAMMFLSGGRNMMSNPMFLMFPMMMLMSMVGMYAGAGRGGGKAAAELNEERKDYFRYLTTLRADIAETANEQRTSLAWSHPDPDALINFAGSRRMWERQPSDTDFAQVRVGTGAHRLATRLLPPETGPADDLEPVSAVALRRFMRTHSVVHALPTAVSLRGFASVGIDGEWERVRALVRSMMVQLASFHAPDELAIAVVTPDPAAPQWEWVKWLPHCAHPDDRDDAGPSRMVYRTLDACEQSLGTWLYERGRFSRSSSHDYGRFLVVVLDAGTVEGTERLVADVGTDGVCLLDLTGRSHAVTTKRGVVLQVEGESIGARTAFGTEIFGVPDDVDIADAQTVARALARYRPASALDMVGVDVDAEPVDPGLMAMVGIDDAAAWTPELGWRPRSPRDRLRVPIGFAPSGAPVELDIKEAAEGGMGPHGLCIGATGSGKSEFLRTLVLAMVATHSPESLNLVLVDFKGGATFLGLDGLAHVSAVITNLEAELALVDRMADALNGEMNRRQELLRSAGNFANVGEYERARAAGAPLSPLPALFIVVDEFSELLAQKPDFADLFVAIGRLGRSLRMHLLLASQRLEEGKLRGLDSHLSYRIGLKTFSANESRSVLGVPDAYHLPSEPGAGYLRCDSGEPTRFHSCYVSGPYVPPTRASSPAAVAAASVGHVVPFHVERVENPAIVVPPVDAVVQPTTDDESSNDEASVLATVVSRISPHGTPAHEVWLPPLDQSPTVDQLVAVGGEPLVVPVALVDRPYDQCRDVLTVDLTGSDGHMAIVGGPQSGKSTAIRSLILAAAQTHSPTQLRFYALDFGGGSIASLAGLPHVGGVATRADSDAVRRTVAEMSALLRSRERFCADRGIESVREFRALDAVGDDDLGGDVVLVIDGYATIAAEFEGLEPSINALVAQGLSFGIHVLVTANRWAEIRPAVKDLIGSRLELRLGDPIDSDVGRRLAATVPAGRPGRGITPGGLHMLTPLPRLDGDGSVETMVAGQADAVAQVAVASVGPVAPAVRTLARQVSPESVHAALTERGITLGPRQIPIGLGENELAPVVLDFGSQPHLMAFADVEHGKTALLRTILTELISVATPDDARIVVADYRRTLLGVVEGDHLAGYASSMQTLGPMIVELVGYLSARLPGDDVTPQQLRDHDWWSGPDIYVVVDDYDMVSGSSGNPLSPLVDLLPVARDIGLHVILARRSGGAGRALYDPVIGCLKDLSADALLMSGDRDEGYLIGRNKFQRLVPGRGELISRSAAQQIVQVTWTP